MENINKIEVNDELIRKSHGAIIGICIGKINELAEIVNKIIDQENKKNKSVGWVTLSEQMEINKEELMIDVKD